MECLGISWNLLAAISIIQIFAFLFGSLIYDEVSYEMIVKSFFWPITLLLYPFKVSRERNYMIQELDIKVTNDRYKLRDLQLYCDNVEKRICILESKKKSK